MTTISEQEFYNQGLYPLEEGYMVKAKDKSAEDALHLMQMFEIHVCGIKEEDEGTLGCKPEDLRKTTVKITNKGKDNEHYKFDAEGEEFYILQF